VDNKDVENKDVENKDVSDRELGETQLARVVVVSCSSCCYRRFRLLEPGESLDPSFLAAESDEHGVFSAERRQTCSGPLGYRSVECTRDLASVLYRSSADVERYRGFREEERASAEARATLLGVPIDLATALMFAERELRVERERTSSPGEYVVGLGQTAVAGSMAANIGVQPQVAFRPERLEIPPEVAQDFLITDLKVGRNSQLVSVGAIPESLFNDRRHEHLKLSMDVAQVGMFVMVSVVNTNPVSRYFRGAVVGRRVPPGDEEVLRSLNHVNDALRNR
jgi:hypothetical protein